MQMKGKHYILRFLFVNRNLAGFVNSSDSYVVTRESASISRHNLDIASNKRCPFFFHLDSQIPRFETISRVRSRGITLQVTISFHTRRDLVTVS